MQDGSLRRRRLQEEIGDDVLCCRSGFSREKSFGLVVQCSVPQYYPHSIRVCQYSHLPFLKPRARRADTTYSSSATEDGILLY
jgi:hypothetical protein